MTNSNDIVNYSVFRRFGEQPLEWLNIDNLLAGAGIMAKADYDADNNGIVDDAENLGGNDSAYHLDTDNHTDGAVNGVYTLAERAKLAGVAAGAEPNVNADWNAVGGDAEILNKPTDLTDLSTHSVTELSDVTDAGSGQIITAAERSGIAGSVTAHSDVTDAGSGQIITAAERTNITHANRIILDGINSLGSGDIITGAERTKLSGIETGATADQNADEVPYTGAAPTNYTPTSADVEGHLAGIDSALGDALMQLTETNFDAFGRLRTANPVTLFESKLTYDEAPEFWDEITTGTGTGTHDVDGSSYALEVTAGAGRVVRQSRRYMPYQPGKSLLILCTGILNAQSPLAPTNEECRIGYFDETADKTAGGTGGDGFFFRLDSSGLAVVARSSASGAETDTAVLQANFSEDTLDGNGPSGVDIAFDKVQIFFIDIEWLGAGTVRMGVVVDGQYITCHKFHHANDFIGETAYMRTATLPVRYEVIGTATGTARVVQICSTVVSEGGFNPRGVEGVHTESINPAGTESGLFSIRARTDRPRVTLNPVRLSTVNTGGAGDEVIVRVYINQFTRSGAFAGSGYTNVGFGRNAQVSNTISMAQQAQWILIDEQLVAGSNQQSVFEFESELLAACDIATNPDEIIITVQELGGAVTTTRSTLKWQEWK